MFSALKEYVYRPKRSDTSLLAKFYWADHELRAVIAEISKQSLNPNLSETQSMALWAKLHIWHEQVLFFIFCIIDSVAPDSRALRDFRLKFPDDITRHNYLGQVWFTAACLYSGSSIPEHEEASTELRPMAKVFMQTISQLCDALRNFALSSAATIYYDSKDSNTARQPPASSTNNTASDNNQASSHDNAQSASSQAQDAPLQGTTPRMKLPPLLVERLIIFDNVFANFEYDYVSKMVRTRSANDFEQLQILAVLMYDSLIWALNAVDETSSNDDEVAPTDHYEQFGITSKQVELSDPHLMFSLPRLSVLNLITKMPTNFSVPYASVLTERERCASSCTGRSHYNVESALAALDDCVDPVWALLRVPWRDQQRDEKLLSSFIEDCPLTSKTASAKSTNKQASTSSSESSESDNDTLPSEVDGNARSPSPASKLKLESVIDLARKQRSALLYSSNKRPSNSGPLLTGDQPPSAQHTPTPIANNNASTVVRRDVKERLPTRQRTRRHSNAAAARIEMATAATPSALEDDCEIISVLRQNSTCLRNLHIVLSHLPGSRFLPLIAKALCDESYSHTAPQEESDRITKAQTFLHTGDTRACHRFIRTILGEDVDDASSSDIDKSESSEGNASLKTLLTDMEDNVMKNMVHAIFLSLASLADSLHSNATAPELRTLLRLVFELHSQEEERKDDNNPEVVPIESNESHSNNGGVAARKKDKATGLYAPISRVAQLLSPFALAPTDYPEDGGGARTLVDWQPDWTADACALCSRQFWLFVRRHHCRACGKLICDSCCQQAVLPFSAKAVRCCKPCASAAAAQQAAGMVGEGEAGDGHVHGDSTANTRHRTSAEREERRRRRRQAREARRSAQAAHAAVIQNRSGNNSQADGLMSHGGNDLAPSSDEPATLGVEALGRRDSENVSVTPPSDHDEEEDGAAVAHLIDGSAGGDEEVDPTEMYLRLFGMS